VSSGGKRLLVTILGVDPRPCRYSLQDRHSSEWRLAPVALLELLPQDTWPDSVLAFCTPQASQKSLPVLKDEIEKLRKSRNHVSSPLEVNEQKVDTAASENFARFFCEEVLKTGAEEIIFDLTHGPRHLVLYGLLGAQYLAALYDDSGSPLVKTRGVYYGRLGEQRDSGSGPSRADSSSSALSQAQTGHLHDLQPLLSLFEWIYALRTFTTSGDANPLARLIEQASDQNSTKIARELRDISLARMAGLPLELGILSSRFIREERVGNFKKVLSKQKALLEDELSRVLESFLRKFALDKENVSSKRDMFLNHEELSREAKLIDDLLEHERIPQALGLMNEWTVSWVLLQDGRTDCWLDYRKTRSYGAAKLNALQALREHPEFQQNLSGDQRKLGEFWRQLSNLRNAYHHHGMRKGALLGVKDDAERTRYDLEKVREYWSTLKEFPQISPQAEGDGIVLVSPQGTARGVLFSAVMAAKKKIERMPDKLLVICSKESAQTVEEALNRAGFDKSFEKFELSDPLKGIDQIDKLSKQAEPHLARAREVLVNLTGGTTLMGLVAAAVAERARKFGLIVRRFGLIDPRPYEEQRNDPYREGDAFWLEDKDTRDGAED